jgi:small subunit ribosomal protein S20
VALPGRLAGRANFIDNGRPGTNNTRLFKSQTRKNPVANIKSARKRARQAEKTRKANMGMRSMLRTKIKIVVAACDAGNKDDAVAAYKDAVPVIDSMINKGIVSKNKAARHKSRLNKRVKALAV